MEQTIFLFRFPYIIPTEAKPVNFTKGELSAAECLAVSYQITRGYLLSTPPSVLFERAAELVTQANKIQHVPRAQATRCQERINTSQEVFAPRAPRFRCP